MSKLWSRFMSMSVTFPVPKHRKHGRHSGRGLSYDGSRSSRDGGDFAPYSCPDVYEQLAKERCHGQSNGETDGARSGRDWGDSRGREGAVLRVDLSVAAVGLRGRLLDPAQRGRCGRLRAGRYPEGLPPSGRVPRREQVRQLAGQHYAERSQDEAAKAAAWVVRVAG